MDDRSRIHTMGDLVPQVHHFSETSHRSPGWAVSPIPCVSYIREADRIREQKADLFSVWGIEPPELAPRCCVERRPNPHGWSRRTNRFEGFSDQLLDVCFPSRNAHDHRRPIDGSEPVLSAHAARFELGMRVLQFRGVLKEFQQVRGESVGWHNRGFLLDRRRHRTRLRCGNRITRHGIDVDRLAFQAFNAV